MVLYLPILKWIEDMFDKFEDIKSIMDTYVIFEDIFYRIEDIFQWFEYIFNKFKISIYSAICRYFLFHLKIF